MGRALPVLIALLFLAVPASAAAPDRPLWLGDRFEDLSLDGRFAGPINDARLVTFNYGEAAVGESWPLSVQNWSLCDRHPLEIDLRPHRFEVMRGVPVIDYGSRLEVLSARTNAVIFHNGDAPQARRAVAALRPESGGALDGPLPAARLPRWVLRELRLVRQQHRRLGNTRALRRRLGISRNGVRLRLSFARALGPGALRGVEPARVTPGQVVRERRALLGAEEGVQLTRAEKRRAARHRARVRRC